MSGGYRYGAGRPACHNKTESFRSIDVLRWAREGKLKPHNYFGWCWTRDGEEVASIGVRVDSLDYITLKYACALDGSEEREDVSFPITLTSTPCYFGGERVWFVCPHSGRRVAKLYCYRGRWYSRKSLRLVYRSQSEDYVTRIHRNIEKIENILIGGHGKKYLHRKTIDRLVEKMDNYEYHLDMAFVDRFGDVFGSIG